MDPKTITQEVSTRPPAGAVDGAGDRVAQHPTPLVEFDLELRRYDGQGWRAMFFPSGFVGSAWALSGP